MSMERIVMMQEISGPRGDGRAWPPPGVEFEVDAEEARFLTHVSDGSNVPLAKYAEKRTETADAKVKPAETREDKEPEAPAGGLDAAGVPRGGYEPKRSSRPGAGKGK